MFPRPAVAAILKRTFVTVKVNLAMIIKILSQSSESVHRFHKELLLYLVILINSFSSIGTVFQCLLCCKEIMLCNPQLLYDLSFGQ